jgi:hypothetical protein
MEIAKGYEPLTKLDFNVMANKDTLAKFGFPISEIDKIDSIVKARKQFIKHSKELSKSLKEGNTPIESLACDVCDNKYLSIIKLVSPEQENKIPLDWQPYTLKRIPEPNDYRAYIIFPLGMILDYENRKIYAVCCNCRVLLGLKSAETGILYHTKVEGTNYGFVFLDRVESLKELYGEQVSKGNIISPILDFDVAVRGIYG